MSVRVAPRTLMRRLRLGDTFTDAEGEVWTVTNLRRFDREVELQSGARKRFVQVGVLARDYEQVNQ